ncbi:MAG: GIY-YIG nuclease family protein [Actinomycetota bacterium]|nr:GIY-YIG nuclease family protein [Actinomycetota bacterium]
MEDAGYPANKMTGPIEESELLSVYVDLARRLGKLPTRNELKLERSANVAFPSAAAFSRRFGSLGQTVEKIREYCMANSGNEDVLALCPEPQGYQVSLPSDTELSEAICGYVYLIKSGRFYKIGRSNDAARRQYEIRLQQPEPIEEVWKIKTDDPQGIEAYWHRRFAERRKHGEWFDLRKREVDAFKRWRRIY